MFSLPCWAHKFLRVPECLFHSLFLFKFSVSISQLAIDNWIKYKEKPKQGQPEDKPWEARTVLMKVQNQLQRDVELSMQTVVSCLADYPERYVSHTPATLCFKPFIDCIDADDQAREHVEILRPEDSRQGTATESFFGPGPRQARDRDQPSARLRVAT
jgi:hypothetical protein